jgi:glyoxylase-like metal-dependent hydrolase (beta-lactamase superfamily II)
MSKTYSKLEIIDLDIPQLGYYKFISSWLYTGSEGSFLVDPGPACTIPILKTELAARGIKHLDWVLLTHIHQDHAGGLGDLIKLYPRANVVVHEAGAKHLIDPEKLWDGSREVLGEVALVYDRILPVPEKNVMALDKVPFGEGIKVISTPGHASHHQCYVFKNWFFAGELFGAHLPMDNGLYLRPATPHRFKLEDYLNSMDLVEDHLQENICFAHYGIANNPKLVLKTARNQLRLWVKIIKENKDRKDLDEIFRVLLENDENFIGFNNLNPEMKIRERYFSINSIEGILEYLRK